MSPRYRRRRKLVDPRLQMRLTGIFVGLSALSLLLQFVLFTNVLHRAAVALPNDSVVLLEDMNGITLSVLGTSFLAFLPLTFAVGVLATFRIAGPIYRFTRFLEALRRGEKPSDFRLRKGDQLQDFAALLMDATRPMREEQRPERQSAPDATAPPLPADRATTAAGPTDG